MEKLQTETSAEMGNKLYKTIQYHLQTNDIELALKTLRKLAECAETGSGIRRPSVQLLAAKSLIEIYQEQAKLEIESEKKPSNNVVNIYNTTGELSDDPISISQRLNLGLSQSVKR
jgi:hypothetical protein